MGNDNDQLTCEKFKKKTLCWLDSSQSCKCSETDVQWYKKIIFETLREQTNFIGLDRHKLPLGLFYGS